MNQDGPSLIIQAPPPPPPRGPHIAKDVNTIVFPCCAYALRTIGAVVHGGSTIFCSGSPVGCMKPWKFQVGYSEI